jgi:hypothetical protein
MYKKILFILIFAVFITQDVSAQQMHAKVDENSINTHKGILFEVGNSINLIGKKVTDDTFLAGIKIATRNEINGDMIAFGKEVLVDSLIHQDLRVVGKTVDIQGEIFGNITVVGDRVRIGKNAVIHKNLLIASRDLLIEGSVLGSVEAVSKITTLNTAILNPWKIRSERLILGSNYINESSLSLFSSQPLSYMNSTIVSGSIYQMKYGDNFPLFSNLKKKFYYAISAYILFSFIIGSLLLHLFPNLFKYLKTCNKGAGVYCKGFLVLLIFISLASLLGLTIIGIPIAFVMFSVLLPVTFFSQVAGAYLIGSWLLVKARIKTYKHIALVVGYLVYISSILVPNLGSLLQVLTISLTTGIFYLFFTRKSFTIVCK